MGFKQAIPVDQRVIVDLPRVGVTQACTNYNGVHTKIPLQLGNGMINRLINRY